MAPLEETKLINILYLVEVEYYREHQERLTDLEWRFGLSNEEETRRHRRQMKKEAKREIVEEIRRIYQKKEGITEEEARTVMSKTEELELILSDGLSRSLIALLEAGFKEDDFALLLFRWLLGIFLDILCPDWDEEEKKELIEPI